MKHQIKRALTGLALFVLAVSAEAASKVNFYKDIRPLIEANCLTCHTDKGLAFSLEDPASNLQLKEAIVSAVTERRMPPWLAEGGHQNYIDDVSLSNEQIELFSRWSKNGFKTGKKRKSSLTEPASSPFQANRSYNFLEGKNILPNQKQKDDYRCFVIDWQEEEMKYITGFLATPGNLKVAHHFVVFLGEPEVAQMYRDMDKEVNGDGYPCYASSVSEHLSKKETKKTFEQKYPDGLNRLYQNSHWLAHWAPGMEGYKFPLNTGIPVKPGSVLIVQMHYYSAFAPGETDSGSAIHFLVADEVAKPAIHVPVHNGVWLGSRNNNAMTIPPGKNAHYTTAYDFKRISQRLAHFIGKDPNTFKGLELHSANLHMHSYGHSGQVSLVNPHGKVETLLSIPRWDLHWQRDFTFAKPKLVKAEQFAETQLKVNCRYANYSDTTVYGGFGSDDEMCFNFSYISLAE